MLTPKQEAFAQAYAEGCNASEAYRRAYDCTSTNINTVNRRAFEVLHNGKVKARIDELRGQTVRKHRLTVESLLEKLDQAFKVAAAAGNGSAMATSVMAMAKLSGLDKEAADEVPDPVKVEVTVTDARLRPR